MWWVLLMLLVIIIYAYYDAKCSRCEGFKWFRR